MKLTSKNVSHSVTCPTSKSHAARALILASLKTDSVQIFGLPKAQDTTDLLQALVKLGIEIKTRGSELTIKNSFPECEIKTDKTILLNGGEGGTTIRFLLPLLSLGQNTYKITYCARMLKRPMEELYQTLSSLGVSIKKLSDGVLLKGPIQFNQTVSIDCEKSSQFASAFELLKLNYDFEINYLNLKHSLKYFEITQDLVTYFKKNTKYTIPVDFSSFGYFAAWAALNQDILINNLFELDNTQADSKIIDILEMIGVRCEFSERGAVINKCEKFRGGIELDGSICIDLVPTICFIASYIPFTSLIKNIKKLKYKECDRLLETLNILTKFEVRYSYDTESDTLQVFGSHSRNTLSSPNIEYVTQPDHRMIMLSSLFIKHSGGGVVEPSVQVNKSFPDFFTFFH